LFPIRCTWFAPPERKEFDNGETSTGGPCENWWGKLLAERKKNGVWGKSRKASKNGTNVPESGERKLGNRVHSGKKNEGKQHAPQERTRGGPHYIAGVRNFGGGHQLGGVQGNRDSKRFPKTAVKGGGPKTNPKPIAWGFGKKRWGPLLKDFPVSHHVREFAVFLGEAREKTES